MAKGKGNGAGRPTIFTAELGAEICLRMMTKQMPNNSLTKICDADDMPSRVTVYYWLLDAKKENAKPEFKEFFNRYGVACNVRLDNMFDEAFTVAYDDVKDVIYNDKGEIGNSTNVSRAKVKIDMIKWALSKLDPEKYGDRIKQDIELGAHKSLIDAIIAAKKGKNK